jgi:hypothetical protein
MLFEPRCERPKAASPSGGSRLELHVVFTDLASTLAALASASELARDLNARITIVAAQVVPYPLPLTDPPVPVAFTERVLLEAASAQTVDTRVDFYLCRDRRQAIRGALKRDSLVVIGGRKRWWPTGEESLARVLKRDGHRVILQRLRLSA